MIFPRIVAARFLVATNKCPILPYRGVARTGVCFALELVLDAPSPCEVGLEPTELRRRNLVRPEQMPFDNITGKHFDSGDYPEALRRAAANIDLKGRSRAAGAGRAGTAVRSASASLSTASRRGTARQFTPVGACRWSRASSRRRRG